MRRKGIESIADCNGALIVRRAPQRPSGSILDADTVMSSSLEILRPSGARISGGLFQRAASVSDRSHPSRHSEVIWHF